MKDEIISCPSKYYEDYIKTDNYGIVSVDVHLITSEDISSIFGSSNDNWDNSTSGLYKEYQGVGPHLEMLQYEYAKKNIELIFSVLNLKEGEAE